MSSGQAQLLQFLHLHTYVCTLRNHFGPLSLTTCKKSLRTMATYIDTFDREKLERSLLYAMQILSSIDLLVYVITNGLLQIGYKVLGGLDCGWASGGHYYSIHDDCIACPHFEHGVLVLHTHLPHPPPPPPPVAAAAATANAAAAAAAGGVNGRGRVDSNVNRIDPSRPRVDF